MIDLTSDTGRCTALPGLYRDCDGRGNLLILDVPACAPGKVVVGQAGENWAGDPALRRQVWATELVFVEQALDARMRWPGTAMETQGAPCRRL